MNKFILNFILILFISNIYSQKIKRDIIDEFTDSRIIETSWERMGLGGFYRFKKVNGTYYFNFKYPRMNVFSVAEGAKLILKLEDGSRLTLFNSEYEISSIGAGAIGLVSSGTWGVSIYYPVTELELKIFEKINVEKYRIYTSLGYNDIEMKSKHSKKLKKSALLILR